MATGEAGGEVCVLDSALLNYRLVNYIEVLPDSAGRLSIEDVTDTSTQQAFQPYREYAGTLNSHQWYWGRVRAVNRLPDGKRSTEWVLYLSGNWTRLEVFTRDRQGNWHTEPNGTFLPPGEKPFVPTTRGNLVKLSLPPGEVQTIYFRGMAERVSLPPSFHAYLQTTDVFYNKLLKAKVSNAVFIGFLGMMLLYNLMVYFLGRARSFIYYSGYLLMMIVYACYSGSDLSDWFGDRLFPGQPEYYSFFKLSIFIGLMCYLSFIRSFADLKQLLPRWDRYFKILVWLGFPLMAAFVAVTILSNFSHAVEDWTTVTYIILVVGSCTLLLYPLYRTRDKKGAFVFAGVAVISLGCLLSLLTRVAFPPFTLVYLKAGVVVEVLIFSLGLAYRQRKQIQAREQADYALRESRLLQEKQRMEADRLQELTEFKTQFYTNITHEFRTPLTVIMGMSERIQGHAEEKQLIERNGKNLLGLVNQLLDLSKLESGSIAITWIHDDIVGYLRYLTESFYSAAEQQRIRFMFYAEEREIRMDFDESKVLRIVNNLIANALRFTPSGGKIIVHASKITQDGQPFLRLVVKDSGVGISPEHAAHVFERFYQVDQNHEAGGTGIGLALTRELVDLMGGTISVSSEVGVGTDFEVLLPIRADHRVPEAEVTPRRPSEDRPELLVIEDNPDIITYLRALLGDRYSIHTALDGASGIEKALELVPDIIISDVMMPEKDGFAVCETLKADERTSHVPIILLTAKTTHEARIEGLKYGADAYLTKPFNKDELIIRLEKLIEVRQQLQQRYGQQDAPPAGTEAEDTFIQKLHGLIHDHLDDTTFGVAELAAAAGLSSMQLYRKIKAITGKTPSRFVRSYRLREGMRLLREGHYTVSEVAYAVGFSDPSYFSRTFQEEFHNNPSHFINV
ncbi:ATP-binding protein [Neolewinella litorea]|nr:ATP-binding protein [Neolewinella litorea]